MSNTSPRQNQAGSDTSVAITDSSIPDDTTSIGNHQTQHPTISDLLWLPYQITRILSHPYSICVVVPMLLYHLFVYIYLGVQAGGSDFYLGFMYAFNYAGTGVAYWIICRQSQRLLGASNIISIEVVPISEDCTRKRCLDRCIHGCQGVYHSTHFQLLENVLHILRKYPEHYNHYRQYCDKWQRTMKLIFLGWMGFATVNIIIKALPDRLVKLYTSFDDCPMGLYGYYNLVGQYLAAATIVTGAVTMLSGFYQLRCLILGYTANLRKNRIPVYANRISPRMVQLTMLAKRETYLTIQKATLALGELWSIPVTISLFFCTQVVIANILVIHYSLADCGQTQNCGYSLMYPFIWLFSGLFIMGLILMSMASINQAAGTIRQIFVYAKGGAPNSEDYSYIGGRKSWIDYLESNRLEFCICGMAITPTLVVNASYTVATAIASFLASSLFG